MDFAINHIAAPKLSVEDFFAMVRRLGANWVEIRNDIPDVVNNVAPEEVKAAAEAAAAAAAPAPAPTPRSLKQVDTAGDAITRQLDDVKNVEQLVQVVRQLDAERRRLRTLLEQIANTIDEALGYAD